MYMYLKAIFEEIKDEFRTKMEFNISRQKYT